MTTKFLAEFLQVIGGIILLGAFLYPIYSILKSIVQNKKALASIEDAATDIQKDSAYIACVLNDVNFHALVAHLNPSAFIMNQTTCLKSYVSAVDRLLLAQAYSKLDMIQEGRDFFDESMEKYPELSKWKELDPLIRKLYDNN